MQMCGFVDVRTCKMRRLKTLVHQLKPGLRLVGQLGSGVRVSASFQIQIFPLRILLHYDIRINIGILHVRTYARLQIRNPHYTPGP